TLTFNTTVSQSLVITAKAGGNAAGAVGAGASGIDVIFVDSNATPGGVDSAAIQSAIAGINSGNDFTVTGGTATTLVAGDAITYANVATGGRNASTEA